MPDEAVSDSGPIIHLAQIGQLDLLNISPRIYIPAEVYSEVTAFAPSLKSNLDRVRNVERVCLASKNPDWFSEIIKRHNLGLGELQALSLCRELGKKLFLTDDLDARETAEELKLEPHGSVGIIVLAYRKRRIDLDSAEKAMRNLYKISNLFITQSIIDIGIAKLKKHK